MLYKLLPGKPVLAVNLSLCLMLWWIAVVPWDATIVGDKQRGEHFTGLLKILKDDSNGLLP